MKIEETLKEMQSFNAISDVLNGVTLHDLQCIDIMKLLYIKKAVVSYDTGTGKTLLASAVMQLLWREDPNRRFIIFVTKDQLQQTPKKIEKLTGVSVITSTACEKDVRGFLDKKGYLQCKVIMLTHECLRNHLMMKELWTEKDAFYGIFIDEAHRVNNKNFAMSADMISGMCTNFEYCIALTATPFTTDLNQLAKLASLIDGKRYPNYKKLKHQLESGLFTIKEDPLFFINRSGKELGRQSEYVGRILWVPAMHYQTTQTGGNALMELCKGEGAVRQAEALAGLLTEYHGKRGLVYVNQHSVREWVLPFLQKEGIRYECINGETKADDRKRIMHRFNEAKDIDVIITSVTTAIDLDCDYVVFYEFTVLIKQMIGRADRGLKGKTLDIWYVLTKGSWEPYYFLEHIVKRSELTAKILEKDIKEVETISDEVTMAAEATIVIRREEM